MNNEDIKLRSLANLPVEIEKISIKPVLIKDIVKIGYEKYNQYLNVLLISKEQLVHKEYLDMIPSDIGIFDIIAMLEDSSNLHSLFYSGIEFFLGTSEILYDNGLYINGNKITNDLYEQVIQVIKIQNCISKNEMTEFNPVDQRAKQLREKILENRRKIKDLKKNTGDDVTTLTFFDLVSILSSNANGINIFNVFEMNLFQFNDQFNRMKLLNDYEVSIQSLLHGADPNKIKITHWMSKS